VTPETDDALECQTCRFWHEIRKDYGECRRLPPPPIQVRSDDVAATTRLRTLWPVTQDIDFCGEFSARSADAGP
jgi:hypothetical protein